MFTCYSTTSYGKYKHTSFQTKKEQNSHMILVLFYCKTCIFYDEFGVEGLELEYSILGLWSWILSLQRSQNKIRRVWICKIVLFNCVVLGWVWERSYLWDFIPQRTTLTPSKDWKGYKNKATLSFFHGEDVRFSYIKQINRVWIRAFKWSED